MSDYVDEDVLEITEEQLTILREFGYPDLDIEGLSMAEANTLIDEARSERETARKAGQGG